jgi:hypothetical protein
MSKFNEEESEIQNLMEQAPSGTTPPELMANLRLMATAPRRAPSIWPARIAMVGLAAVAATAIVVSMTPRTASARSFQRVVSAVDGENGFSFSMSGSGLDDKSGKFAGKFSMSGTDHSFKMHADDGTIMEMNLNQMRIYDPKKNEVLVLQLGGVIDMKQAAKEFSSNIDKAVEQMDIKKMLSNMEKEYGKENVKISPLLQRFGKTMYTVDLEKPGQPDHVHIDVNADTDLPEKIEMSKVQPDGNVQQEMVIQIRFGGAAVPETDHAEIPANAKVNELNIGKLMQDGLKGLDNDKASERVHKIMERGFKVIEKGK